MAATKSVKNEPVENIKVQAFVRDSISFTLVGTAPLMTNRLNALLPGDDGAGEEEGLNYDDRPKKNPLNSIQRFQGATHIISGSWLEPENIVFGFPVSGIKKAVAATAGRFTRRNKVEINGVVNLVGGVISHNPPSYPGLPPSQCQLYPIIGPPPVHDSRGVCLSSGAWNRAHRARWDEWRIPVTVEYDRAMIEPQDLINLFRRTGFQVGIGVMRREKGYDYGSFDIEIPEEFKIRWRLV